MENNKELDLKKLMRPKSSTRYSNRSGTFIVAFALQEPPVNDVTKMTTTKKRSTESFLSSSESLSNTGSVTSTKTLTISTISDIHQVPSITTIGEMKIDMIDGNQCGDTEKTSLQINNYQEVDNKMSDEQPKIIFNAANNMKRFSEQHHSLRKKQKTYKHVIKFKNVHFKYKNSRSIITRRLEKYYVKAKTKTTNSGQIKKMYSNTLSKVVSRSQILKKVLAKENLLVDNDHHVIIDISGLSENDIPSVKSEVVLPTSIPSSHSSENTLVKNNSFSFESDDTYSLDTVNSVIAMSSEVTTYNTDMKIAVAVAFTPLKSNNEPVNYRNPSVEVIDKGNTTSTDTIACSGMELTSQLPSDDNTNKTSNSDKNFAFIENYMSTETLTGLDNPQSNVISNDDTFLIARASCESNRYSLNHSDFESTSISDTNIIPDDEQDKKLLSDIANNNNISQRTNLLDTVKNLGFYPEMTPSTSSGGYFDSSCDNIVVKNELVNSYPQNHKTKDITIQKISKNIFKKSFDTENKNEYNHISLPNEDTITAILRRTENSQKKTSTEEVKVNKPPSEAIEIWDRLNLVLDLAMKRLEDTLAEKIIREVNKSLSAFTVKNKEETVRSNVSYAKSDQLNIEKCERNMLHKEVYVVGDTFGSEHNQGHQCNLVQNEIIDQLLLKLSLEGPKAQNSPQVSLKSLKKPEIHRNYFGILKQPGVDVEVGKGDTVTVATATGQILTNGKHK